MRRTFDCPARVRRGCASGRLFWRTARQGLPYEADKHPPGFVPYWHSPTALLLGLQGSAVRLRWRYPAVMDVQRSGWGNFLLRPVFPISVFVPAWRFDAYVDADFELRHAYGSPVATYRVKCAQSSRGAFRWWVSVAVLVTNFSSGMASAMNDAIADCTQQLLDGLARDAPSLPQSGQPSRTAQGACLRSGAGINRG
jgi:hypothetical protein